MGEFKSPETKEAETMLGQAASMMMADGKMEESELAILRGIAARLGVGEADVERILSNPGEVDLTLPQDPFKRALFLIFIISMMCADGTTGEEELKALHSMGSSVGYTTEQIEAAVEAFAAALEEQKEDIDPALIAVGIASHFG